MASRMPAMGVLVALIAGSVFAQSPPVISKKNIPGIRNYSRVDATVGCGGATATTAFAALAQEGFVSIVNLRLPDEPGSDIPAAKAAAGRAGLKYFNVPFDAAAPGGGPVRRFLEIVTAPDNQPVYVHCGSGNRVGAVWLIKRVVVDRWTTERATAEAKAIGLSSPALEAFSLDYIRQHRQ